MHNSVTRESCQPLPLPTNRAGGSGIASQLKDKIRNVWPTYVLATYRFFRTGDWKGTISFLFSKKLNLPSAARFTMAYRFFLISAHIPCEHLQSEIYLFVRKLVELPAQEHGCIVEAGCFKGGGTAKLSIAAKLTHRRLISFDSFEGIPHHDEIHEKTIWGGHVSFVQGDYCGSLDEVQTNVTRFGEIKVCQFVKGYFEDTMPHFRESIVAAFLDVDLVSSTRSCLKCFWPLLVPGGVLFSHDGHLPLVLNVFQDDDFWKQELGCAKPEIHGLGKQKLIWMQKPVAQNAQRCSS
jgi:O-methyltransferase